MWNVTASDLEFLETQRWIRERIALAGRIKMSDETVTGPAEDETAPATEESASEEAAETPAEEAAEQANTSEADGAGTLEPEAPAEAPAE